MSMDCTLKKPSDFSKINPKELGELMWWSYMLCISPERLLAITSEVGESTESVKKKIFA